MFMVLLAVSLMVLSVGAAFAWTTWEKYRPILDGLQSGKYALVEDHAVDPVTAERFLIHPKLLRQAQNRVDLYEAQIWNAMIRRWSAGEMLLFYTDRGDISRFGPMSAAENPVDPVTTSTYLSFDQDKTPQNYGLSPIIPLVHANRVRGIIRQKMRAANLAPFRSLL